MARVLVLSLLVAALTATVVYARNSFEILHLASGLSLKVNPTTYRVEAHAYDGSSSFKWGYERDINGYYVYTHDDTGSALTANFTDNTVYGSKADGNCSRWIMSQANPPYIIYSAARTNISLSLPTYAVEGDIVRLVENSDTKFDLRSA